MHLDHDSGIPVYVQLEEQLRLMVHQGVLKVGDPLPTTRALAAQLGVNVNTIARVYRDLQRTGLLRLERGVGSFVAEGAEVPLPRRDMKRIERKARELVELCRAAGMSAVETGQLIQEHWSS